MGIIGDFARKLFGVIWSGIKWLGEQIHKIVQFLIDFLMIIIEVVFALIGGLLYLIFKIGVLAIKLFDVLLTAGGVLWSFVVGLGRTLGQLVFMPLASSPNNAYGSMIGRVMTQADAALQLTPIAYIMLFVIWVSGAVGAIKIISSIRVGGD